MALLYEEKTQQNARVAILDAKMQSYGQVSAIRIKDMTRNIWYSWDSNQNWDNSGGGGSNAPVGETPRCKNGGQFYIAIYVVNEGFTVVAGTIYINNTIIANNISPSREGIQIVAPTQTMPATGNVHVKIVGGPQTPSNIVEFDITGIPNGGGGTTTQVTVTDAITKKPIAGALVTSGTNTATTDSSGTASIISSGVIHAEASGYLAKDALVLTSAVQISLIPIWAIGLAAGSTVIAIGGIAYALTRKK